MSAQQGTDLVQQINALPEAEKQALLEGIGGSIGNILLKMALDNVQKWIQKKDPAIQKAIFDKLLELVTTFFKK